MRRILLRNVLIGSMTAAGTTTIASGIIYPYRFDIFEKCVTGEYGPTANMCVYGPQISINILASLLFFGVITGLLYVFGAKLRKITLLKVAALSFIYFWILTASWRLQVSLYDNFVVFNRGPETLSEHLWSIFQNLDTIIIGVLMGAIAWLPVAANRGAVPASKRKEPRITFPKKK